MGGKEEWKEESTLDNVVYINCHAEIVPPSLQKTGVMGRES